MIKNNTNQRPRFLNLLQIRLPVTGVASILHRLSGIVIFLVLPVVIYGLGLSLQGEPGFNKVQEIIESPICQLFIVFTLTSVFYHLLAGIRFLLFDLDIGHDLSIARLSARIVIAASAIILVLLMVGVFAS